MRSRQEIQQVYDHILPEMLGNNQTGTAERSGTV
jgi:hypothetical protein